MAPFAVNPERIQAFETAAAFEQWLAANHTSAPEIWIKIHKKGSGLPTVTHAEALDVALCWGWIDAIRKPLDDVSFLQRFTPRNPKSLWSQRNREHIERLIAAGRMQPPGFREVEKAKGDGRWDKAYAPSAGLEMPADLMAAIAAEPEALALYQQLNAQNRYALFFRTHNLKTEAGRRKKIESLVAMLKRGETPHPNRKRKA